MKNSLSETDLMIYILAVDKGYCDLLELYGMLHAHDTCPRCGSRTGAQYKLIKEIVATFGSSSVRIPRENELQKAVRDITIWNGLRDCPNIALKSEEYARRYNMQVCNVSKIRTRIQLAVDRFSAMRRVFKRRKRA